MKYLLFLGIAAAVACWYLDRIHLLGVVTVVSLYFNYIFHRVLKDYARKIVLNEYAQKIVKAGA